MKILIPAFAAVIVIISLATLHMANANPAILSSFQPKSKQDILNNTITDNLRLANQSSQMWLEKLHPNQPDDQQPITANALNSHSNNKFDNRSPSVIAELPF
jgi:hypothetical protein